MNHHTQADKSVIDGNIRETVVAGQQNAGPIKYHKPSPSWGRRGQEQQVASYHDQWGTKKAFTSQQFAGVEQKQINKIFPPRFRSEDEWGQPETQDPHQTGQCPPGALKNTSNRWRSQSNQEHAPGRQMERVNAVGHHHAHPLPSGQHREHEVDDMGKQYQPT